MAGVTGNGPEHNSLVCEAFHTLVLHTFGWETSSSVESELPLLGVYNISRIIYAHFKDLTVHLWI